MMMQPRLIVRGQGHHQRALGAQLHVDAGSFEELRRESGPARLALAPERDQRLLARLRLAAGRQHAGGRVGRAGAGAAAIEHLDHGAAHGEPPRDAEPDHAGADDGDLGLADRCNAVGQEAAPFAGMTQTGSVGLISAATAAAPKRYQPMMGILASSYKPLNGMTGTEAVTQELGTGEPDHHDHHGAREHRGCSPWAKP